MTYTSELSAMLLDVVLETHAWASARPKHESQVAAQKFEKKISQVMEVEKEQGTSPFSLSSLPSVIFGKSHSIMINQTFRLRLLSKDASLTCLLHRTNAGTAQRIR